MDSIMEHLQLTEQTEQGSSPSIHDGIDEDGIDLTMEDEKGPGQRLWAVPEHTVMIILQMVLLVILCIIGTLTNSLVFWIFNRRPALRSLSNRFVLSLVTANIFISTLISPLLLFDSILAQYLLLPYISPIISTISNSVLFSAIFSTLLIATDRFYAVTSPLHYSMTITRSRSQIMIVVAWICGTVLALPTIILYCAPLDSADFHQSALNFSVILQIFLGYLVPFFSLCWLYLRMYHAAHRNSERTRKHSISGELLTVMDGSTSVIPQGIDFLTHYMNPFSKTPMSGSIQSAGHTTNGVLVTVKKPRRRSSNGSSSSLLFREEGRAIKTAFFVLASFLLCWSPHFFDIMQTLFDSLRNSDPRAQQLPYGGWSRFLGVTGMLLSSVLNPFIYVFRNKMACKEVTKLLCGFIREHRRKKSIRRPRNGQKYLNRQNEKGGAVESTTCNGSVPGGETTNEEYDLGPPYSTSPLHHPPATPLPKSPRRSSMKSLTPQSSLNSNSTQVNFTMNDSSSSADSPVLILNKPPFLRSMTLPEQPSQQHVKFPPMFTRQKSCVQRTVSGPPVVTENNRYKPTPGSGPQALSQDRLQLSRRPKFTRQDSICSIVSNDSVLMYCPEDRYLETSDIGICGNLHTSSSSTSRPSGLENSSGHHRPASGQHPSSGRNSGSPPLPSGNSGTPSHSTSNESAGSFSGGLSRSYLRQDSNFSDVSHKTNDSGVVSDMAVPVGRPPIKEQLETTFTTFTSPDHLLSQQQFKLRNQLQSRTTSQDKRQGNTRLIFCTGHCVHDLPLLQTTI